MTRKDYILIAGALRYYRNNPDKDHNSYKGVDEVAEVLADHLIKDNPRFDREHFLAVVRGTKSLESRPKRKS